MHSKLLIIAGICLALFGTYHIVPKNKAVVREGFIYRITHRRPRVAFAAYLLAVLCLGAAWILWR